MVANVTWPSFLATTSHKLIYFDGSKAHTMFQSDAMLYGLTWSNDRIYLTTRHDVEEHKNGCVIELDPTLGLLKTTQVNVFGRDLHEALFYAGILHVCNTDKSEIVLIDPFTNQYRVIRWTDRHTHPNSIWHSGLSCFVLEHNHEHRHKRIVAFDHGWRRWKEMDIHIELEQDQERRYGFGAHNVYSHRGVVWTLTPKFVLQTLPTSNRFTATTVPGTTPGRDYLRGMAHHGGRFLIGVSTMAERSHRGEGDSRVVMIDERVQYVDEVVLEGVGQILTIRTLAPDYSHNMLLCPFWGRV